MSLTRDEWLRMWDDIKRVEYYYNTMENPYTHDHTVKKAIANIKQKIQQVIGQME